MRELPNKESRYWVGGKEDDVSLIAGWVISNKIMIDTGENTL